MKRNVAAMLRRWAQRLDPAPDATRMDSGGWVLSFQGVPLAEVSPGVVADGVSTRDMR